MVTVSEKVAMEERFERVLKIYENERISLTDFVASGGRGLDGGNDLA